MCFLGGKSLCTNIFKVSSSHFYGLPVAVSHYHHFHVFPEVCVDWFVCMSDFRVLSLPQYKAFPSPNRSTARMRRATRYWTATCSQGTSCLLPASLSASPTSSAACLSVLWVRVGFRVVKREPARGGKGLEWDG